METEPRCEVVQERLTDLFALSASVERGEGNGGSHGIDETAQRFHLSIISPRAALHSQRTILPRFLAIYECVHTMSPPLELGQLLDLQRTVLWFRIEGADEIFRVTADRIRNREVCLNFPIASINELIHRAKDLSEFVNSLLTKIQLKERNNSIPLPGKWSILKDNTDVDLTRLVHKHGSVYEVIGTSISEKQDLVFEQLDEFIATHWTCSRPQHQILGSASQKSILVLPRRRFMHISAQLWQRWISKKKRETKHMVREIDCLIESNVSFQQVIDLLQIGGAQIYGIELLDLDNPDATPQNINLSKKWNDTVTSMTTIAASRLRMVVTTSL